MKYKRAVHAPVPATLRVAVEDDIIPLSKPFTDKNGVVRDHIRWVSIAAGAYTVLKVVGSG